MGIMRSAAKLFSVLALLILGIAALSFQAAEAQSPDFPAIISSVSPDIPLIAVAARASGKVVVDLSLDAQGRVVSAKAIGGHPLLRGTTERAASQWRFSHTSEGPRTVRLTFIYPVLVYGESASINVLPYRINLQAEILKPRSPETVSYVPADWRAEKDRCKVHGEILKKERVQIIYGLIGFREGYLEAEKKLFPNANPVAFGGCVIEVEVDSVSKQEQQTSPKYAEVLYCRKCRLAEQRWIHRNRYRKLTT